jgi:hypothetical protein
VPDEDADTEEVAAADGEVLPAAAALRVVTGCEEPELLDDRGLHPAATSALTTKTVASAAPRRHRTRLTQRTRIANPYRPALLTGDAITELRTLRIFHYKRA